MNYASCHCGLAACGSDKASTCLILHPPYCSFPRLLRVCLMLLSQGIDAAVNGYWESRNAGKLFKHMTIPEQE